MIKVQNNIATRDPLPLFLQGLAPESLADLSWTDPALGVQGMAWWPEETDWAPLEPGERHAAEVLTVGTERQVVISTRTAEPDPDYVAPDRHITRLAFLSRFADAEAIAIDLASTGNTVQAAGMRRYLSKVNAATYIDLERADTRAGVQALEAGGLLGSGRALQILDAPVMDNERWRGV